jgi:hypothetical protein
MPDWQEIERSLRATVERFERTSGVQFSPGAREFLWNTIHDAAERMSMEGRDDDASLREARTNLRLLLLDVTTGGGIEERGRQIPSRRGPVERGDIAFVLAGLCPIWPFC